MKALTEMSILFEDPGGVAEPAAAPRVSVLVLVAGRPEPLKEFYFELRNGLGDGWGTVEFVFVVEQVFLPLAAPLLDLAADGEPIRVVRVGHSLGHTALLREGFAHCRGEIILTLPSRRRVETPALARLIDAVEGGADMAVATRRREKDSLAHRAKTRVFHFLASRVAGPTGARVSDMTSGVRAIRRHLLEVVPLYGESGRFLPLLALREGFKVAEVQASQHLADQRAPLPSPLSYVRSLFDLLSLFFLLRFTEKPLRFFGLAGAAALLPGAALLGVLVLQRLQGEPLSDRPLLLVSVLFVMLGIQMIALGLVGEIIVHIHASERPSYRLLARAEPDQDEAGRSARGG